MQNEFGFNIPEVIEKNDNKKKASTFANKNWRSARQINDHPQGKTIKRYKIQESIYEVGHDS